jgi:hypothetical protein
VGAKPVPSREDLLALIDMRADSRRHTVAVLKNLPGDFPNVDIWLRPV